MGYTIEQTDEDFVIRFARPVTADAVETAIKHLRSHEILKELVEDSEVDLLAAAEVLADLKKAIGTRTRGFLENNEEYQRLINEEE